MNFRQQTLFPLFWVRMDQNKKPFRTLLNWSWKSRHVANALVLTNSCLHFNGFVAKWLGSLVVKSHFLVGREIVYIKKIRIMSIFQKTIRQFSPELNLSFSRSYKRSECWSLIGRFWSRSFRQAKRESHISYSERIRGRVVRLNHLNVVHFKEKVDK